MSLAPALAPFMAFAPALRSAGFPVAPEQTQSFIASVGLLGPRSIHDIRRAARAIYGPGPDRDEMFDAVFDAVFLGRALHAPAEGMAEDMPPALDAADTEILLDEGEEDPSGEEATRAERLFQRQLATGDALTAFRRALPAALPRRRSRRMRAAHGNRPDPARAFRQMLRRDGEITRLPTRTRRHRQRKVLWLIDVSGSMKTQTEGALRTAHALMRGAEQAEVFTLGTRLTRVSRALKLRDADQALAQASGLVADWDGGTRLGEALQVFLSVPRFAAFARGALVIVLSDGLERGGPEALTSAMPRLSGLAQHILWLNPLAGDPGFRPETAAMQAVLPYVDHLADGSSEAALAREILAFGRAAR
ncbi:MAG: vWA domain-containing protein [Roseinatronobacter sp.]